MSNNRNIEIFVPGLPSRLRFDVIAGTATGDDYRLFASQYEQGVAEGKYDNPYEVLIWCDQLRSAADYADTVVLMRLGVENSL